MGPAVPEGARDESKPAEEKYKREEEGLEHGWSWEHVIHDGEGSKHEGAEARKAGRHREN